MKLANLRLEQGDDGRSYVTGTTKYTIPAGTIVLAKRDGEAWTLWAIEPRKPNVKVEPLVFTGLSVQDANDASRKTG